MPPFGAATFYMTHDEWESLCDGCGKCCDIGCGVACPSLDADRRCTVYDRRTEVERCVNVTPANVRWLHSIKVLPDSCGYVRHLDGLPPVSVEYPLIPFMIANMNIQKNYIQERQRTLDFRKGISDGL